ncbi:uncharacterized protein LOC130206680 [Pseudoliparis swirei]|uniref:uncharacterized protein LOC130206680 n=1 Tax=Pseudoliparis swirei TaxID=2059687 RepID=UPI0024BE3B73|nr:uncharacterized protein LOC130206680 [Pseudoliparis swirei]
MANYRTKLRGYGVPEVMCNALKRKSPGDQKSAKNVKKPRKAEVNYLPPYPAGEDEESQEQDRIQLLTEVRKRDNKKLIKEKMAQTFAHRRNEIVNQSPAIEDIKARWPALFEASNIQDEFLRITTVHLESKFMSKLDEHSPRLLSLFHSKGGAMGLRLQTILLKAPGNPNIDITRDVVIRCLMVYLGESDDQLFKEYDDADQDSVAQDLAVQGMTIYSTQMNLSEGIEDIGIVIDGSKVLTALGWVSSSKFTQSPASTNHFEPSTSFPAHNHPLEEHTLVIELYQSERENSEPDDRCRRPPRAGAGVWLLC